MNRNDYARMAANDSVWSERHDDYRNRLARRSPARTVFTLLVLACFVVLVLWALSGCQRTDDTRIDQPTYTCHIQQTQGQWIKWECK